MTPPTPSPAWTLVSHTDTGKEAGSSKPNTEHDGGGAETSPNSGQGRSWTDRWESPAFPGPSAKADPEPRGPNPDRPHHLPTSPSPTSGRPLHHPTSDGWPALPTLLLGPEALVSLPPHTLHTPPPSAGPVSFPAGMTTSASSPASQTLGLPSDPLPALQPQQNFLEPNPGTSCSLQPLPGFLGTQDEATHTPTTPRLLQGSGSKSLSLPLEMTTAPMVPP